MMPKWMKRVRQWWRDIEGSALDEEDYPDYLKWQR